MSTQPHQALFERALTKESLEVFQKAYFSDTGERLTLEDAREKATQLLELGRILMRPVSKQQFEQFLRMVPEARFRRVSQPDDVLADPKSR